MSFFVIDTWAYWFENAKTRADLLREHVYVQSAVEEKILRLVILGNILDLSCSLIRQACILLKNLFIRQSLRLFDDFSIPALITSFLPKYAELWMQKLASCSIRAKAGFMKLQARLGFKIRRNVLLLDKFVLTMSERTRVTKFASSRDLPIFAHLSLQLCLIRSHKLLSITNTSKLFLGPLNCCHLFLWQRILWLINLSHKLLMLVWTNDLIFIKLSLINSVIGYKIDHFFI